MNDGSLNFLSVEGLRFLFGGFAVIYFLFFLFLVFLVLKG